MRVDTKYLLELLKENLEFRKSSQDVVLINAFVKEWEASKQLQRYQEYSEGIRPEMLLNEEVEVPHIEQSSEVLRAYDVKVPNEEFPKPDWTFIERLRMKSLRSSRPPVFLDKRQQKSTKD